eukprot:TRINITY_DN7052_c0_g1_i1.p1 TRINITY_DN7052_c0_g1~~TRINITY_DN7052_c0_g1_i1.p1  ORF type:complete len:629 (+),score=141.44 TRINITY_DN7052_c0_g1_i1:569-2455(+)
METQVLKMTAAEKGAAQMRKKVRVWTADNAVQTDASIMPSCESLQGHLEELSTKHWLTLKCLRTSLMTTASHIAGVLYDVIAFKNVACRLPGFSFAEGSPLTDLLLITSKFHRHSSLLARQLSTFFDILFAEGIVDEQFHFTEMTFTKKKLTQVTNELEVSREEIKNLQIRVKSLEARESQSAEALQRLELTNTGLEVKSASLEDQMALLFEQIADDYIYYNEEQLRYAAEDNRLHERLAPVRSAFSHSIDAVQHRLKFFQDILSEITIEASQVKDAQDEPAATTSGGAKPKSDKAKLKSLEIHLHHLTSRFTAVREGLQQTAAELHTALIDKKKVVNLSVQHLKVYELQNNKLQTTRAKLCEVRKSIASFQSSFRNAFPAGTLLTVSETGVVTHYHRNIDGSNDAVKNEVELSGLINGLDGVQSEINKVTEIVSTSDEHRQLMKTVALNIPSGQKKTKIPSRKIKQQVKQVNELLGVGKPEEEESRKTQDGMLKLKNEYSAKVEFIREVYEDRIRSLEAKVEMLIKKLTSGDASNITSEKDMIAAAKRKWLQKKEEMLADGEQEKIEAHLMSLHDPGGSSSTSNSPTCSNIPSELESVSRPVSEPELELGADPQSLIADASNDVDVD